MLEELATELNAKLGLTGEELEIACLIVGAALADTIPELRAQGLMDTDKLETCEVYQIGNHFSRRLHAIRQKKLGKQKCASLLEIREAHRKSRTCENS